MGNRRGFSFPRDLMGRFVFGWRLPVKQTPEQKLAYMKEYRHKNKQKLAAQMKAWSEKNAEHRKEWRKEYSKKESSKNRRRELATSEKKAKRRTYLDIPHIRMRVKFLRNQRNKKRIRTAEEKIKGSISTSIRHSLRTNRNSNSWRKFVDYTIAELRSHLQRQFLPGMSWDNSSEWHIDHITPKIMFDLTKEEEIKKCWSLSNLRPLWAKDNAIKNKRRVFLL